MMQPNGPKIRAVATATATRIGSAMRRRASLNVQNASETQSTTSANRLTLIAARTSAESKKSRTGLNGLVSLVELSRRIIRTGLFAVKPLQSYRRRARPIR